MVDQAVTTIVLDHPFFASLLLQMKRIEDPSVDTACTDGIRIRYNPDFIEGLTPDQVSGLLAHEVMHPALGHLHRLPPDAEGNIAGDFAINNLLDNYNNELRSQQFRSMGKVKRPLELPEGGLLDHELDDLSAEQILGLLRAGELGIKVVRVKTRNDDQGSWGEFEEQADGDGEEAEAGEGSDADGKDKPGQAGDAKNRPGRTPVEMAAEWERRLVQAATATKMQGGDLPGCIRKLVDRFINPRVPWQRLLERFVENTADADYSWHRPDRRFLDDDIVIPEIHDTTLGEIVVAVDTSGSIFSDEEALGSFESELNSIIGQCRPRNVIVLYCDAQITGRDDFGPGERVRLNARGGGGTDFRPVGDYINEHNIQPRVCIYLTDLYGTFPEGPWDFPVIWCVYGDNKAHAPFGDTVHMDEP
jgi:predicted metal-dependent peptidase